MASTEQRPFVEETKSITYTYSIKFEESEIDYGTRWDAYLYNNTDKGFHWFSITNSIFIVLFLSVCIVILLFIRLLLLLFS